MNNVTLIGHLGRDAESKKYGDGKAVVQFSLAVKSRNFGKEKSDERTDWITVVAFGGLADRIGTLTKGERVFVEGSIRTESWDDKKTGEKRYAVKVIAKNVYALQSAGAAPTAAAPRQIEDDEDIPF